MLEIACGFFVEIKVVPPLFVRYNEKVGYG